MRKTYLLLILIFIVTCMTSCSSGYKVEKGMRYSTLLPSMCVGIQTNKTEYEIDNFVLDFYYGWEKGFMNDPMVGYEIVGALIYVSEGFNILEYKEYDDYNDIDEKFNIIKVVTEDLNNEKYFVEFDRLGKATYKHQEKLLIPNEIMTKNKGSLKINITSILRNIETWKYIFNGGSYIIIEYEILENGNVNIAPKSSNTNKTETITN